MQTLFRIYIDFISNFFSFLLLLLLVQKRIFFRLSKIDFAFFFFLVLYSIPTTIKYPYLVFYTASFIYVALNLLPNWKKAIQLFTIYFIADFVIGNLIGLIQFFLLWDVNIRNNSLYSDYQNTICSVALFVVYQLYLNTQEMKDLGSKFSTAFNFVIIGILITTSYIILYFFSVDSSGSFFLPVIISTQLLFIVLCLILYSRFIIVLKEQISLSFTLEKNKLEQAYNKKIEKSLRELHSLRHDMRNHLLIIDGYAQKNDNEKVHNYASKLIGDLKQTAIIDTPSPIVSSLLSIKYEEMIQASIQFHHTLLFDSIRISEKDITIILGNLLDNAITAAGKCNDGYINLEIKQISNMLEIHIENNHIEKISESNNTLITSKNDPNHLHGLGIKNVRTTVERLHGQINISHTSETFSVDLLLPN